MVQAGLRALASYDRTVRLWAGRTYAEIGVIGVHRGPVVSVTWTPDSRAVVSASIDGTARLWPSGIRGVDQPPALQNSDNHGPSSASVSGYRVSRPAETIPGPAFARALDIGGGQLRIFIQCDATAGSMR